jgi:DNA-binding transcriptional ArsR family regulator
MVVKVSLHNLAVNAYRGAMVRSQDAPKKPRAPSTPDAPKASGGPTISRTPLTLNDPRAIRAIAHEARQQVIDELYSGSVLTATEAAQLCGLSPSAMSYHLRALEKWGVVVRDDVSSDGRERPWRAAAQSLNIGRSDGASSASMRQAANAVMSMYLIGLNKKVDAWLQSEPQAKDARWSSGRLYLTDEEAAGLNRELDELIERYDGGRTSRNKPADALPRDGYWLLLPHVPGGGR